MLEILLDNKDGVVWDISELVSSVTWKTVRIGRPGSLDLTLVKHQDLRVEPGAVIRVKDGQRGVFYGYVFTIEQRRNDELKVTAYDQLRYLLSKDTRVFENVTASDVLLRIANDLGLKTGIIAFTSYRIPTLSEEDQPLIDIIGKALDLTLINTGRMFVLYDNFGALALREPQNIPVDVVIGDESLAYDYTYKRSIDEDTYNVIKLVRDNEKTGKREVYMARDSANIARWGRLQYLQKVDENMNEAQIRQLLDQLATLKNRETRTFRVDAIGDSSIRAGVYVFITIEELGTNQYYLVDECTHKWNGGTEHTMSLTLKVM